VGRSLPPSLSEASGKGSGAPPHDAHLVPRLVHTLAQAHDVLQLANVRRHGEYISLAVRGDQLLGKHLQRVDVDVSNGHFEPEATSRAMSAHLGKKKKNMTARNGDDAV